MKIIISLLSLARPKQWIKNILVFAGLIFAKKFFDVDLVLKSVYGFIIFSLISSCIYVFNDIIDRDKDRKHSRKKNRPIASGQIKSAYALLFGFFLLVFSLYAAYIINYNFFLCVTVYFIITSFYSVWLKNIVIIDVIIIALGFVIRAVSGAYIINVEISSWLIICTFLLSLLIGFGKRRSELNFLGEDAGEHRRNLELYSVELLNSYIYISAAAAILSYSLYCMSKTNLTDFHSSKMIYTIPFAVYGIFRYIFLILRGNLGDEPETIIYKDSGLLSAVILWAIVSAVILARA
jgi:4-hydroxybenzoate polyprenyltransferase